MKRTSVVVAGILLLAMTLPALANAPDMITYQGRLKDSDGHVVDGFVAEMTFSIYDAPTGGVLKWTESQLVVPVDSGLFTVNLGSVNPIPDSIFHRSYRYLEIAVNGETISSRTLLVASPYSMVANAVRGDIYTEPDKLGIGVSEMDENLVVGKNLGARSGNRITIGDDTPGVETGIVAGADADNRAWMLWNVDENYFSLGTEQSGQGYNTTLTLDSGRVGIGTTEPSYKLTVVDLDPDDFYGAVYGVSIGGKGGLFQGEFIGAHGLVVNSGEPQTYGVVGEVSDFGGTNYGVYGSATNGAEDWAGYFVGDVNVTGNLSKGGGSFRIDHPLDPGSRWLYHSFVESPDMMNVYNGNVILDESGEASVELPDYFESLNRDFRYQLTCIGSFAPVYVAEKIQDGVFKIAGGAPGMEVSWQVTGIRQDPYANANRIQVEVDKNSRDLGKYAHPEAYGLDETKSIDYEAILRLRGNRAQKKESAE